MINFRNVHKIIITLIDLLLNMPQKKVNTTLDQRDCHNSEHLTLPIGFVLVINISFKYQNKFIENGKSAQQMRIFYDCKSTSMSILKQV